MIFTEKFVTDNLSLDWSDVLWGYRHQQIGWRVPIQIAEAKGAAQTPLEAELAQIGKDQDWRVGQLVEELAAEIDKPEDVSQRKWLFLTLLWLYENRDSVDNPLRQVEVVYADFDYPDEISEFVLFMPAQGGYDPRAHTHAENHARLFAKWKQWLDTTRAEFS